MQLRIIVLTALCALAGGGQILTPASAAAMDDAGTGSGKCVPMTGVPGVYWNDATNEFCAPSGSAGGEGSGSVGGDDSVATVEIVGEEIVIEGTVDPCMNQPDLCWPRYLPDPGPASPQPDSKKPVSRLRFSPGSSPDELDGNARRYNFVLCRQIRGKLNVRHARFILQHPADFSPAVVGAIRDILLGWNEHDCGKYLKAKWD